MYCWCWCYCITFIKYCFGFHQEASYYKFSDQWRHMDFRHKKDRVPRHTTPRSSGKKQHVRCLHWDPGQPPEIEPTIHIRLRYGNAKHQNQMNRYTTTKYPDIVKYKTLRFVSSHNVHVLVSVSQNIKKMTAFILRYV